MGKKGQKRARDDGDGSAPPSGQPAKRKRQVTDDKLELHKLYNDLAAESENVRLEAAKKLILKFSPENGPSADAVHQALNRLIQGLCTQRKAARFGFCVTLTELLRQLFDPSKTRIEGVDLSVDSLLQRIEKHTKIVGNVSGKVRSTCIT